MGHVGEVVVGDEAPVLRRPVRIEPPLGHGRGLVGAGPLERPQVFDGGIGIKPVRTDAEEDGRPGVRRPHHVREPVHVVGARHLVRLETRHVETAGSEQFHATVLVCLEERRAGRERGAPELVDNRSLLRVEQPAEAGDERRQDLTFVDLIVPQAEPGTGTKLAAGVRQPPVVGVGVELDVLHVHVVGPRQKLGMRALDVVPLVEGVDDDLPVGGQDGGAISGEAHLFEVEGAEELGDRIEEVDERLGLAVHVHEHEASPALCPYLVETEVRRHVRELVAVDDLGQLSVEGVAPGVVPASDLAVSKIASAVGQPGAPVQAGVEVPLDVPRVRADHEDRLVADRVLEVVARLGHLFLAACDLPDPRPQLLHLEIEELPRDVPLLGDEPVVPYQHRRGVADRHGSPRSFLPECDL